MSYRNYDINEEIAIILNNAKDVKFDDPAFSVAKEVTKEELEILKKHAKTENIVSFDGYDVYTVHNSELTANVCCKFEITSLEDIVKYTSVDYWINQINIYECHYDRNVVSTILKVISKMTDCEMIDEAKRCKYISDCIENYYEALRQIQISELEDYIQKMEI